MNLVLIIWTDTGMKMGWKDVSEIAKWAENEENFTITTVGYLVGESDDWIIVAPSYTQLGDVANPTRIQRGCIKDIEVLHYAKEAESD